jgi:hypothetical protein
MYEYKIFTSDSWLSVYSLMNSFFRQNPKIEIHSIERWVDDRMDTVSINLLFRYI